MTKNEPAGWLEQMRRILGSGVTSESAEDTFPFLSRPEFLSPAELSLYRALCPAAGEGAVVLAKVSLGDIFYPKTGDRAENLRYFQEIVQRRVDFLLCSAWTMQPLLGVELIEGGDEGGEREEPDPFQVRVFAAARLPLLRVRQLPEYDVHQLGILLREKARIPKPGEEEAAARAATGAEEEEVEPLAEFWEPESPSCPECGRPMVLRTYKKEGPHKGKKFWSCFAFPDCRGVREYKRKAEVER